VDQVRVAVHEAGHNHATGSVDLGNVALAGHQPLNFVSGAGGCNRTVADDERTIANDTQVAER
jgi:hypothetical protein